MKKIHSKIQNKKATKFAIVVFIIVLILAFESLMVMLRYNRINRLQPEVIGVSFSQIQAERYGSDWRANYIALLDELNFKNIRIPAYWNRIEPAKGQYDFTELDWMVSEAGKRDAKIIMIVGQKNIRYPECYYPGWVDTNNTTATSDQATDMIRVVVERYKNNPTVTEWQLENEFLLKSFGNCPSALLTNAQLQKELLALKSVDSTRPVILTQSDQFGFPLIGPFAEKFGFSMYRWSWNKNTGYYRYPQNGTYFWWKAGIISLLFDQQIKIHELQAEAWGPRGNEYLSYEDTLKSMNPQQFRDNINYARETKIKNFDLWGSEWWWHLKQTGHPEMWEEVRNLLQAK